MALALNKSEEEKSFY